MAFPKWLTDSMRLPLVGSPMFILSTPELVLAQCKSGVIGAFPSLNARGEGEFEQWLQTLNKELADYREANPDKKVPPYAVNLIVHRSNNRLQEDLELVVKYEVPIVITSLGAREEVNEAVHSYGGIVLHDIINNQFAQKAVHKGADGLIAVAAGAGGHAGTLSPLALIQEIREWFDGPLLLSGAIATGDAVLAAQAMGADAGYMGSAFIATEEANAVGGYKQAVVDSGASDIKYTNLFTGVHGNYLVSSILAAGLDPDNLPEGDVSTMNFKSGGESAAKAWKDIWGCGQGVGAVNEVLSVADFIDKVEGQYVSARKRLQI